MPLLMDDAYGLPSLFEIQRGAHTSSHCYHRCRCGGGGGGFWTAVASTPRHLQPDTCSLTTPSKPFFFFLLFQDTSIPIETLLRKPAVQVDTAKTVQVTKKRVTEEPLAAKPKIAVKKIATAEVADAHSNLNEFKSAMEDFAADIQAAKTE